MRRLFLALILIVVTTSTTASAAIMGIGDERKNALLINPGDLFTGVLSLEYERGVARWLGITFGTSVWTFRSVFTGPGQPSFTALTQEIGFRFHFIRHAPRGLWIGPYATGGYLLGRSEGTMARAWSWGLGAATGYNFLVGRHFTFQLGAGGGFTDYGDEIRWDPRLKLGIGATF